MSGFDTTAYWSAVYDQFQEGQRQRYRNVGLYDDHIRAADITYSGMKRTALVAGLSAGAAYIRSKFARQDGDKPSLYRGNYESARKMPRRRRRTVARRAYKRRAPTRRRRRARRSMFRSITPFKREFFCTLNYSTGNYTMQSTAGAVSWYWFRANSLADPEVTVAGHQPRFFETLCNDVNSCAPYYSYRVLGAVFTVRLINENASIGLAGTYVGTKPDSTVNINSGAVGELPVGYRRKTLPSVSAKGVTIMTRKVSIRKCLGIKDLRDDPNTKAIFNASPTRQVFFGIAVQDWIGSSTQAFGVCVDIKYRCQFFTNVNSQVGDTGAAALLTDPTVAEGEFTA